MIGLAFVAGRGTEIALRRLQGRAVASGAFLLSAYAILCVMAVLSVRQTLMWRDSGSLWEAALKVNKTSFAAYHNFGWVCMKRGELDKALFFFQKALERAPRLNTAYLNMGVVLRLKGNIEQARAMFEKAAELDPFEPASGIYLGTLLKEQGKNEEAIPILRKFVERIPKSAALRTQLALAYFETGRESEALKELNTAEQIDPLLPDPYIHKARIFLSKGEPGKAAPLLRRALKLRPNAEAYNMLGTAYASLEDLPAALQEFTRAYKMNPRLPEVRANLANALLDLGKIAEARAFCAEAEGRGSPCSEEIRKRLSEIREPGK